MASTCLSSSHVVPKDFTLVSQPCRAFSIPVTSVSATLASSCSSKCAVSSTVRLSIKWHSQKPRTRQWHQTKVVSEKANKFVASSESPDQVYDGVYGPWSIESSDRLEVYAYRAGLVTSASAFLLASSSAFLPEDSGLHAALLAALDPLFAVGAGGLGLALLLVHIYVTPLKRFLQLLWLVGAGGSLAVGLNFAASAEQGLVEFVIAHPGGVWAVGPLFASLTGLVFKEGLCYGKLEAAALFFVIPTLLLGHLSGGFDPSVERGLLAIWMALFTVFAARKFTQPIKDDIGDKSVFLFQALPREQQETLIARLRGGGSTSMEQLDDDAP